jgi:hypothetical protein
VSVIEFVTFEKRKIFNRQATFNAHTPGPIPVRDSPKNRVLPIKKSTLFTPFFFSWSCAAGSAIRTYRCSYAIFTLCFSSCDGSALYSSGCTARRSARWSTTSTSRTVTNESGIENAGVTVMGQGRSGQTSARNERGG